MYINYIKYTNSDVKFQKCIFEKFTKCNNLKIYKHSGDSYRTLKQNL